MEMVSFLGFVGLIALPILIVWALIEALQLGRSDSGRGYERHRGLIRALFRAAALSAFAIPVAVFLGRPQKEPCPPPGRSVVCEPLAIVPSWMPWSVLVFTLLVLFFLTTIALPKDAVSALLEQAEQVDRHLVSNIPVPAGERPITIGRQQLASVQLECQWHWLCEGLTDHVLDPRLGRPPLLVADEQTGHDEDRLLRRIEVFAGAAGLVHVCEVHAETVRTRHQVAKGQSGVTRYRYCAGLVGRPASRTAGLGQ